MFWYEKKTVRCNQTMFIRLLENNFSGLQDNTYYKALYHYLENNFNSPFHLYLRETVFKKFIYFYIKGGLYDETVKRNLLEVNYDQPKLKLEKVLKIPFL